MKINAAQLHDRTIADRLIAEADSLIKKANEAEHEIIEIVNAKIQ